MAYLEAFLFLFKMSGEPPRKKTRLESNPKKSNLKNAVRAAHEEFDPPFPDHDQDSNDERENATDRDYDADSDPEGDLEIAPGTAANTRLNTGFSSAYGQHIARSVWGGTYGRYGLRIIAPHGEDHTEQGSDGYAAEASLDIEE